MRLDYASREKLVPARMDRTIFAILVMALALRIGWVLSLPVDVASLERLPDQREYFEAAHNLLAGNGLQFIDPRFSDTLYAGRMPGYPAFIALCRGNIRAVRIVQSVLDASSVLAVWLLARQWGSRGGALLSAAIVALNPFLIYFCGLLLSETLFTAMLIWGMYLLVARGHWWKWMAGAVLLALSIYIRPSAIALPIVLGVIAAFVNRERHRPFDWRWAPPVATMMLVLIIAALFPWASRNQRVLGKWIWTTTNSGITFYDGFHPNATGASDQTFVRDMPQLQSMGELSRSKYLGDRAWNFIQEHPAQALRLAAAKIGRTWSPMPLSQDYGGDRKLILVALVYMLPFYVLIIMGICLASVPRALKVFLAAPALYFTVIHAASVGSLRYRIPADVPMAIVAGLIVRTSHPERQAPALEPEAEVATPST